MSHRKRVKHYHEPGDTHEFTFSCYRRWQLLDNDERRRQLCTSIDRAVTGYDFRLVAFVIMPEHVHLLVYPIPQKPDIPGFLSAVKRPFSYRVKQQLIADGHQLLELLTIRERPGKMTFRFWQEGPGYDRNLNTEKAVLAAIAYIHENPVRRGLCELARDWKWSSCRWYESNGTLIDPELPTIHGLPWEFFTSPTP
jgi:putative transposase